MLRLLVGYKRLFVLFLIVILLVFFLFPELQKRPIYYLMRPFAYVVSTIQYGLTGLVQGFGEFWSGYMNLTRVQKENNRMRQELMQLQAEKIQHVEDRAALNRLEQLLVFKTQAPYPLIAARVIGRDPSNWYRTLMIDKGEKEGIKMDMGVMVPSGVIGRVIKTTPDFAIILLLTDRNSAIPAIVQRTRDEGIVEGTEKGAARIKYLSTLSEAIEGDFVVTSGLIGNFPKGLLIGEIHQVERKEMALFHQAEIIPAADFSKLEEVLVIGSTRSGDPKESREFP